MKKVLVIGLCLLILFPAITKTGVFIWFKANQDYIAEVLCINKDKKELDCKGCCVLNTKLQQVEQADEESANTPPTHKAETEWQWFTAEKQDLLLPVFSDYFGYQVYQSAITLEYSTDIFHPPSLI